MSLLQEEYNKLVDDLLKVDSVYGKKTLMCELSKIAGEILKKKSELEKLLPGYKLEDIQTINLTEVKLQAQAPAQIPNTVYYLKNDIRLASNPNSRAILDLIENEKGSNNETFSKVVDFFSNLDKAKQIQINQEIKLLKDLSTDTPKETTYQASSMVLAPIITTVTDRLSTASLIVTSDTNENLIASADNSIVNLGKTNDSNFEIWSKVHYNYNRNSNGKSIHVPGITLGGEYNFKDNKYKVGLAYTFSSGNGYDYIANSISLYSGINNIDIKNFKNNFANIVLTYGRLNAEEVKDTNKLIAIKHKYNTDVVSLNTTFGHNIVLSDNNGIVTPILGLRYDYINRNAYTNNVGFNYREISMNIVTPMVGISYVKNMLNDTLNIRVGTSLGYGFNLNKNIDMLVKVGNGNNSRIISFINNNTLNSNTNFGLTYKVRKDIELSLDSNISFDMNKNFSTGFSLGGRYKF